MFSKQNGIMDYREVLYTPIDLQPNGREYEHHQIPQACS